MTRRSSRPSSTRTWPSRSTSPSRSRTWVVRRTSTTTRADYQVKATQDIQLNRFDVSYGTPQVVEATVRKELGPAFVTATVVGQNGNFTGRMEAAPSGERYNEVKGYYFERRRATIPATIGTRDIAGRRHRQRDRQGRRPPAGVPLPRRGQARRHDQEARARRRGRGLHRRLAERDPRLRHAGPLPRPSTSPPWRPPATRSRSTTSTRPPVKGGSPSTYIQPAIKYPTYIGVLSHFDAVNWYSGDDFAPQDVDQTSPRRPTSATAQTGSLEMSLVVAQADARDARLRERGRQAHRRRSQHPPGVHVDGRFAVGHGPVHLDARQAVRLLLPAEQLGRRRLAGTAYQRSRTISNDTWQNYLGVVGRAAGSGATGTKFDTAPITPKPGSFLEGMTPFTVDATAGNDPTQNADGTPLPLAKSPLRLRNWSSISVNEPLRLETVQADYTTTPAQTANGGAIISTRDAVTFGFGLEQVSEATRNELVKRTMSHLLPATADTTAPTRRRLEVPDRQLAGHAGRPGRDRAHRVRRARRHEGSPPVRQRRRCTRRSRSTRSSSATPRRPRPSAPRCS